MKHMKVNGTNQKVYFQEDLDRIRRKMRIGDRIETYVYRNRLGEVIEKPRKITRTVVGIYPHLVELESKNSISQENYHDICGYVTGKNQ